MVRIIQDPMAFQRELRLLRAKQKSVGFVPTMGALHEGHAALIKKSKIDNNVTAVSIFVNPTQFNDPKDLDAYPRTFQEDLALLQTLEVDVLFMPEHKVMYTDQFRYRVVEDQLSRELCGAHRPGHFDGVLTVVLKLLNLAQADRAYFGEKDFQQLELIRGMAEAFFLTTQILGVATVREADGLAKSSRNVRLAQDARLKAPLFAHFLKTAPTSTEVKAMLEREGFVVDYIEDKKNRRFGAVHLGGVRLIDNVEL